MHVIPNEPSQYRLLKKFEVYEVELDNWEIDFSQSQEVDRISILGYYKEKNIDINKIPNVDKISDIDFYGCHFIQKSVDFSKFVHCRKIKLIECDLHRIVAWPPIIAKIDLTRCSNLRSIPTESSQYRYLREIEFWTLSLQDWEIDFSQCFYLKEITLLNCHVRTSGKNKTKHPPFRIPRNWAYCIPLEKLDLDSLPELTELPIELSYHVFLSIHILDCSNIPNLSFLPIAFWDCTKVGGYGDFQENYKNTFHPRYYENQELYKKYEDGPPIIYERSCNRERVQFLNYVESMIPKMPTAEMQEYYKKEIKFYRPRILLKNGFPLYL
ncbi:MAG: hypothetical protein K9W44_08500 [Candidatus Lokiarchaeota archaeon]|nr:hypothetical protein [Candidatus Harpocratesius repetitus]